MTAKQTFYRVLSQAIDDMMEHGFDDVERLAEWQRRIRVAAEKMMLPKKRMEDLLRKSLRGVFEKMVDDGKVMKRHPGVGRFTIDKLKPELRTELDRRIMASANLISLNREEAIAKTLQRFSGWATSIPVGGTDATDKRKEKENLKKAMSKLPFEERRVLIDQSHKLTSSISEIIAQDTGAIAAIWHSHYKESGYDYRPDHKDREQVSKRLPFVVRDNWAMQKGLMKLAGSQYVDEMTKPGEEVYCRCYYEWIYNLRELPEQMLTAKGKAELERISTMRSKR